MSHGCLSCICYFLIGELSCKDPSLYKLYQVGKAVQRRIQDQIAGLCGCPDSCTTSIVRNSFSAASDVLLLAGRRHYLRSGRTPQPRHLDVITESGYGPWQGLDLTSRFSGSPGHLGTETRFGAVKLKKQVGWPASSWSQASFGLSEFSCTNVLILSLDPRNVVHDPSGTGAFAP